MKTPVKNHRARSFRLSVLVLTLCLLIAQTGRTETTPVNRIEIYIYGPGIAQVIDGYGRQSGRNLVTGDILAEIPGSDVLKEGTTERIPGWTIQLQNPPTGKYRIKLSATGAGAFVIDVDTVDAAGNLKNKHLFRQVKPGDALELLLTYSRDPGAENTLIERQVY